MSLKTKPYKGQKKKKKLALLSQILTYQILTKDDEIIPSISSILIAVWGRSQTTFARGG